MTGVQTCALPIYALAEALNQLRPDDLTPREALDALYRLKQIVEGVEGGE